MSVQKTCKRTTAQDWHAAEDELPTLGLLVPCGNTQRCGVKEHSSEKRGRHAAAKGAKVPARWACERTAAQLVQDEAPLALKKPCVMMRRCGELC